MYALRTSNRIAQSRMQYQPATGTFDCSEEFSLDHWIRVCKLVNESEGPALSTNMINRAEADEGPASEVESTTANEHLAGNVV